MNSALQPTLTSLIGVCSKYDAIHSYTQLPKRKSQASVSTEGVIRQRRLPDQMTGLAERIGLSCRYYIKNNNSSDVLLSDQQASELSRESNVALEQLNATTLAAQLTLQVRMQFYNQSKVHLCRTSQYSHQWSRLNTSTRCSNATLPTAIRNSPSSNRSSTGKCGGSRRRFVARNRQRRSARG